MGTYPLRTLDPDDEDFSDLEPLRDIVGDARVVAIGESAHKVHEFFQLRHRLTRFLVRELGFSAVALESGFPEGLAVDDWVRGGPGDLGTLLRDGVTYRFGQCDEARGQLEWMRSLNGRVHFYGMDVPGSSATPEPAIEACMPLLDWVDAGYAKVVREQLLPLFDYLPPDRSTLLWVVPALHAYMALDIARRREITARIAALSDRLSAMRIVYGADDQVDKAIRCAATARHTDGFLNAMADGSTRTYPGANIRDAAMAENMDWILDREQRVIVGAHNGHIQREPLWAPPVINDKLTTLGEHLAAKLGPDLVVIGSAFGGGALPTHRLLPDGPPGNAEPYTIEVARPEPETIDAVLSTAGFPLHLTDLRKAAPTTAAKMMNGAQSQPIDAVTSFDAMVYIETVTPWHAFASA
ncbi:erythromycin esterase family protein [Kutzneria sp. NPDC052558]|uniref:erythromycin esterase family protein n=1 Tax=Kutzneria sp. NPDC052558 TaxID=3364121 RepID=UPI0037C96AF4